MNEKPELNEGVPFSDKLVENGFSKVPGVLSEFENDPTKIVRFFKKFPTESLDEHLAEIKAGRSELKKLTNQYGVKVPEFDIVIGQRGEGEEGQIGAYYITNKLDGENLADLLKSGDINDEDLKKVDEGLAKVVKYFIKRYDERGSVLSDITRFEQFVFGVPVDEPDGDKELFLVDIDPLVVDESIKQDFRQNTIREGMRMLNGELGRYERGEEFGFPQTKQTLREAVGEMDFKFY